MGVVHSLRKGRHWLLLILGGVVLALFPWTAYLTSTLPGEHVTHHWDVAWVGFDLFLAAALTATLVAVVRLSPRLPVAAAAAGTALLCDAWFDLITAAYGRELWWAIGEAVLVELPLAALCFWLALEANRVLASGAEVSAAALPPTELQVPPAEAPVASRTPGSEAPSGGRTSH